MRNHIICIVVVMCVASPLGCSESGKIPTKSESQSAPKNDIKSATPVPIVFRSQEIPFTYFRGDSGDAWPVEPTGGGVALVDFDNDGDLDLFFAQGMQLPVGKIPLDQSPADVLLRNDGSGKFVDISKQAGLVPKGYGQGVTTADFDGDGDIDIYVTRYDKNTLWRNDQGKFTDVTAQAGVAPLGWSLGAGFLDYDRDGDLDLFVATYFAFDPKEFPLSRDANGKSRYAMPNRFTGQADVLYRNNGDGTFSDVTKAAGIVDNLRGMGVITADMDGDGLIDIFVANDAQNNSLWKNQGNGKFENVAESIGIAVNDRGITEANMGIAHGDTDGDGLPDVLISHFFGEHHTLWRPRMGATNHWFYSDQTSESGLAVDSRPLTGWGTAFADFDHDGRLDIIVTNGHIREEPTQKFLYDNPPLLWRNRGDGRFLNVTNSAGPYFTTNHQGRGLAVGDLDGDGDLDVVIVHHHRPSVVLWNETKSNHHFLKIRLKGRAKNLQAIGAKVIVEVNAQKLVRTIDGGGSYISGNEFTIHFGLGAATKVDRVEIVWPSGSKQTRENLGVDTVIDIEETR